MLILVPQIRELLYSIHGAATPTLIGATLKVKIKTNFPVLGRGFLFEGLVV